MAGRLVYQDAASLSQAAAEMLVAALETAVAQRSIGHLVLAGGSTPIPLYRLLAGPYRDRVPWERLHLYWGDERLVPPGQPGSNYGQAAKVLISRVPLPAANVHRMKGELAPEAAAADYAAQLRQMAPPGQLWPRFDVALLGLGRDGHTASLFPGPITDEELCAPVMAVTADYDGRPAGRITLTPLVLNAARQILFLVTGSGKAAAATAVIQRRPDEPTRWPAQRIRPTAGELTWLLDRDAAGEE